MNPANKPSQVQLPMNLRFAADELILKSITYNNNVSIFPDISNTVGIWCNVTNDGLIVIMRHFITTNIFASTTLFKQDTLYYSFFKQIHPILQPIILRL